MRLRVESAKLKVGSANCLLLTFHLSLCLLIILLTGRKDESKVGRGKDGHLLTITPRPLSLAARLCISPAYLRSRVDEEPRSDYTGA